MKLSIITPSYNSGKTIERAIKSVLAQDYQDYEHIIIDGGSTDETLSIIEKYPHLKWVSEPDRGQVYAMNKGFALAEGQVIGYLNADDYYLEGVFSAVMPLFIEGEKMVMGKIRVCSEKPGGTTEWICDPKTDFSSVLRHWEQDAFCVNPVGYFYRREVQEEIPLREETDSRHDLEFLMEVSNRYSIKKIDRILGVFNHALDTKTGREQLIPSYWQPEKFFFVERLAEHRPEEERKKFLLDRERGYQYRRHCTAKEAFALDMAKGLFDQGEVFLLPEDVEDSKKSQSGFVEFDRIGTKSDWIIPVFTMGKVASQSICYTLKSLPASVLPAQVYHVHLMNMSMIANQLPKKLPRGTHNATGLALSKLFNSNNSLHWKFIAGVREPIAKAISAYYQATENIEGSINQVHQKITEMINPSYKHFINQYKKVTGINVFDYEFDHKKKYIIVQKGNVEILIYRLEDLPQIFSTAMEEYLGISGLELEHVNISSEKEYAEAYKRAKETIRFNRTFLDQIYSNKKFRHFYTKEEIEGFYERWLDKEQDSTSIAKPVEVSSNNSAKVISCPTEASETLKSIPQSLGTGKNNYGTTPINVFKQFNPSLPVVSIHIPKTAGQSFELVLRDWYKEKIFLHYPDISLKQVNQFSDLLSGQCIHGHFNRKKGFGIDHFVGANPEERANIITIIRNPYSMVVSLFLYLRYKAPEPVVKKRPQNFEKFFKGFLQRGHYLFNPLLDTNNMLINNMDDYIKKYVFIGIQEDLEKSLSILSKILGFRFIKPTKKNVSDYSQDNIPDLEYMAREVFVDEYRLYDHVREIIKSY